MVTNGYVAPEVGRAYTRALVLCQQLGETTQLVPVLRGLVTFHFVRAELQTARARAEQLLSLAQRMHPLTQPLLGAHLGLGITLFYLGELASALTHIEQSIALYDPQLHRPDRSQFSTADRKVVCLSYAARVLWDLGYPDQARQKMNEAVTLARELSHPFSVVFALSQATGLHTSLQDVQAVQEHGAALMTLAREHGFPYFLAGTAFRQGWILVEQGQAEEGIAQMCQDRPASRATGGGKVERPHSLADLAAAHGKVGQIEKGLDALAEMLTFVDTTGTREWEAELYRLKGQLTLQSKVQGPKSQVQEAEECFLKAIEIARRQQAKSLELRAVTSLSRLWQSQGKQKEAHQMLSEIYNWFTEGSDTKDLQEAKRLIDELS